VLSSIRSGGDLTIARAGLNCLRSINLTERILSLVLVRESR